MIGMYYTTYLLGMSSLLARTRRQVENRIHPPLIKNQSVRDFCRGMLNEARRRERELRIEEAEEDELIDSALLPEKSSEYKELQQALIDCLNQLTDRERMVIKLTMQGFMIVGIAEKLKITPKAVYSIFHRAKLKLRKLLQTRGFDGVY
jgi:RNA polymerase sigma factor (sigma-70 family)